MTPLRWTTKSTRRLAAELNKAGHRVSADTVGALLREEGFSLQANAETLEGSQHPDRNAQFRYLAGQVTEHQANGDPVISVDAKKKELVGPFANNGREWRPAGQPERVNVHDFADPALGKAIPYGVTICRPTPAGSTSAAIMTPPRSPSSRSADGGTTRASTPIRRPAGC